MYVYVVTVLCTCVVWYCILFLYVVVVTLTWKNGSAECVGFKLRMNESHFKKNKHTEIFSSVRCTAATSLAWPDRFFPFLCGFPPPPHKREKSGLATRDYAATHFIKAICEHHRLSRSCRSQTYYPPVHLHHYDIGSDIGLLSL